MWAGRGRRPASTAAVSCSRARQSRFSAAMSSCSCWLVSMLSSGLSCSSKSGDLGLLRLTAVTVLLFVSSFSSPASPLSPAVTALFLLRHCFNAARPAV